MKELIFLLIFFLLFNIKCKHHLVNTKSFDKKILHLTNDSIKYWDTNIGYSFYVNKIDSSVGEYAYNYKNERVFADYGDVHGIFIKWTVLNDSLVFYLKSISPKIVIDGKILSISADTLKMAANNKILVYWKSVNQNIKPYDGVLLSPDTSERKVKYRVIKN